MSSIIYLHERTGSHPDIGRVYACSVWVSAKDDIVSTHQMSNSLYTPPMIINSLFINRPSNTINGYWRVRLITSSTQGYYNIIMCTIMLHCIFHTLFMKIRELYFIKATISSCLVPTLRLEAQAAWLMCCMNYSINGLIVCKNQ